MIHSLQLIRRGPSHFDSHTDLTSTWLHLKIFRYWIKNSVSPILKYSELLASHHGDLISEGHLYPCPSQATLTVECSIVNHIQWWCTLISHLHTVPVSPHYLFTRTTNVYGTQWSILDIGIILVIVYRLVSNQFKDYTINLLLLIKIVLKTYHNIGVR